MIECVWSEKNGCNYLQGCNTYTEAESCQFNKFCKFEDNSCVSKECADFTYNDCESVIELSSKTCFPLGNKCLEYTCE